MALSRRRAVATALLALTLCSAPAAAQPRYRGRVRPLDAATRASMTGPGGSWRPGCPVVLADLRVLELDHWGFDGAVHTGRLVVHRAHARALVGVFGALFAARFAVERMEPVDRYGADDHRSMSANNTSAFNCREVAGRPGVWSQHAYGLAIDLNPVQNPYVSGTRASPPEGAAFVRRRPARGLVTAGGPVVRAFARAGWAWGGHWRGDRDYQHFSASGR